jgi:hypothetical protein
MKKERCIYEFRQGNAEANLTIDYISKRFFIKPCVEINASFDGDGDIEYINNLVNDYVKMYADIKEFALVELFGGVEFSWDDKEPVTISANQINGAKELIPVDSLVEVEADVNNDEEVIFYDIDGKKYTSESKIKRIFLEMEK